jgi:hypothetical protein
MLQPTLAAEMLDAELEVARARLGDRVSAITRSGTTIQVLFWSPGGQPVRLELDGARYDAEPFRVAVVDDGGGVVEHGRWPAGLSHSVHPVLGRPFACVQGTFEYHCHPSHLNDRWDTYRSTRRLADLVDHLLCKTDGWSPAPGPTRTATPAGHR